MDTRKYIVPYIYEGNIPRLDFMEFKLVDEAIIFAKAVGTCVLEGKILSVVKGDKCVKHII